MDVQSILSILNSSPQEPDVSISNFWQANWTSVQNRLEIGLTANNRWGAGPPSAATAMRVADISIAGIMRHIMLDKIYI